MGWPALALLAGLLVYFQFSISDPVAKKRATFKTFIGMAATLLLFMAIANYKRIFTENPGFCRCRSCMITDAAFMMALYFPNFGALLKIGGFMFFVAAVSFGLWKLVAAGRRWFSSEGREA